MTLIPTQQDNMSPTTGTRQLTGQQAKWPVQKWCRRVFLLFMLVVSWVCYAAQEQTWRINVRGAPLQDFIIQISDLTGKTFVVDPRVKGNVTVISNTKINAEGIYQLLLSVLQVNGFVAIEAGEVVKVIPQVQGKQGVSVVPSTGGANAIITKIIKVNNIPVPSLVPTVRPLMPAYSHVGVVASTNLIIISDHKNNVERLERLIREIDTVEEEIVEMVSLKEAWVGTLVALLQRLAPDQLGSGSKGPRQVRVIANERNNSVLLRGKRTAVQEVRSLITQLDQPGNTGGNATVIKLSYADAETIAEVITNTMQREAATSEEAGQSPFSIQPDKALNALVVRADPISMSSIKALVGELDIRRTQVLIEAAIVEVSVTKGLEVGGEFVLGSNKGTVPVISTIAKSAAAGGVLANLINTLLARNVASGSVTSQDILLGSGGSSTPTLGAARLGTNGLSFTALLTLLARHDDANLLSTPSILTLNNEEAEIVVGQNVPFRTGNFSTTQSGLTPFVTIERQDIGITLRVTPQINEGGVVRLNLFQEISNIAEQQAVGSNAASDLITNKRTITTSVLADDQETIVLGGLIQNDKIKQRTKVPFFGDIPVLGWLFRSRENRVVKRNLLVFLRPTVLKTKEDVAEITKKKYTGIWETLLEGSPAPGKNAKPSATPTQEETPDERSYDPLYQGDAVFP